MSRVETSKVVEFVALGVPEASVSVSKLVMFTILYPGDDGSEPTVGQGYSYGQTIGGR